MDYIFDTHAHYDDEAFDADRETLLTELVGDGVRKITNIGASLTSCKQTIALMQQYAFVYGALGVHPSEVEELNEESFQWLKEQCTLDKCVAIGEIGLDYYYGEPLPEVQKKWFVRQLSLARQLEKPVVIHSREACSDTIDIMKAELAEEIGGVVHCFSYTKETARVLLDMGYYIGIGGVVTFKNSVKLKEAVAYIPLDRLVLETDSPYLAPTPFRGSRNDSRNLTYVVEAIAELKGCSCEEVCKATWENAHRLYRLPDSNE